MYYRFEHKPTYLHESGTVRYDGCEHRVDADGFWNEVDIYGNKVVMGYYDLALIQFIDETIR